MRLRHDLTRAMLHDFIHANRNELVQRCKDKAAARQSPPVVLEAMDHGVPLFIQQLIDDLRVGHASPDPVPASADIGRSAALHGANLLRSGYNADQVVHGYGDVCQAVTELAIERNSPIETDEFRILNRALDNAIADAVTAFGVAKQTSAEGHAVAQDERLGALADDQRKLVDIAIQAHFAIKTGNIGLNGATGALLVHALGELRSLADRIQSETRQLTKKNAVTRH